MSSTSIALKLGGLVLGFGAVMIILKVTKGIKDHGKESLIYSLALSLMLSLPVLFLLIRGIDELLLIFLFQVYVVVVGVLHVVYSKRIFPWYGRQPIHIQLLMLLCSLILTFVLFYVAFLFLVDSSVQIVWYLSSLLLLIPALLDETAEYLLDVPPKVYKSWRYPARAIYDEPTDKEMENPVVISFEFRKNHNDEELSTFRAKAPVGMSLGKLFYFFINDYNERNEEDPISFLNEKKETQEWTFYKIVNKFFHFQIALDPDDSIYNSNIRENDILLCYRNQSKKIDNETNKS